MVAKPSRRLCLALLAVTLLSFSFASSGLAVTSDDFNTGQLDTGLWWFVDPLSDGQVALDGTRALISVPSGASHDMWGPGFESPRIMQAAEDTDFEIEVKFESLPSAGYQMQGLVVEQDSGNLIRADFYSNGSSLKIFSAAFSNGSPSVKVNSPINVSGSELYLRLARQGNTWTPSYSGDGLNWVQATSFSHSLAVQSVGVFSGNAGAAPAHTAVIDYFFNTAAPIDPEDGNSLYAVTVGVAGSGSVTKNPDQADYQPGDLVELTAVPSSGWTFTGWTGDVTGSSNPITVTVNSNLVIDADFVLTVPGQHALSVLKSGDGSGTVTSVPAGIDCGVDCSEDYNEGTNVVLTVLPDAGSEFVGWTGSGDCSDGVVTMAGPHSCTATFNLLPLPQHTLSISASGAGQVSLNPSGGVYDEGASVQISAIPDDGWLFEGWSGDLVANQNPITLVMDQDYSVVGNFAPDSIPPVISDIQVAAGQTSATVTWTTDEPTTGIVDYGETVAYELGSVQDSVLATGHVVTLTGLDPGVDYHLQVTATDESLNATVSPDVFFSTTTDPSGIVSDDFNTGQLDTGLWWFVDPLSDGQVALDGTRALISVPSGASHDMWGPGFESPRIMQAAEDTDFEIEVKFESLPSAGYQMQGLVVEQDSGNLIRADFYSNGSSLKIFSAAFSNGSPSVKVNSPINVSGSELYLRLARQGNTWTPSYSEDGLNWVQATSFSHSLAVQSVGVFSGNAGAAPAHTAVIDYFFNTAAPIDPEDGNSLYAVTVGVAGSGSVTKNPDQADYQPGDLVELTAVPSSGWTFTGWTGDVTGSSNPITVTVNSNLVIDADFVLTVPGQHALSVLKSGDGSGTVTSVPAGIDCGVDCSEDYNEGTNVVLTVLPDAGSEFVGWTGSGDCSDGVVTMAGPHSCTATFNLLPLPQHTLSISASGAGQVSLNPSGGVYDEGASVQISAIPDDGWLFEGWSGDLVANQNPITLVMDQDYSVVGNFAPDSIPPVISDIQVAAGQTSATVTWTTDEPTTGIVDYGETVAYELGSVQDSVLATGHVVTLTGLDPGVDYHLQVTATDESLNATVSPDVFFSTTTDPSGIVSDDFNTGQLDTGLWWFVDPLSDGQVALDGTRALISVPSGASHDMWGPGFESPRIMQAAEDTDFEIEVKFESLPSAGYQMQGLVVEQDSGNLIRADFYSNGSSLKIFSAAFSNGSPSVKVNSSINVSGSELYLRLARQGNTWTPSYSGDGLNWVQATSFSHSLGVQSVGVFSGNAGAAPAHTAVIDYFFNTAAPIDPEDGNSLYAVTVGVAGSGSVTKNPDQADYQPGDLVELTAVPSSGWTFTGWTGDVTGSSNPITVTVNSNLVIDADFVLSVPLPQHTLSISALGAGQVALNPAGGVYDQGSSVQISAIADDGWLFEGWSGDLVANQNPITLVMDQDYSVVGNFAPDSIPPVISDIQVAAGQTSATVTWTTDEPTTGIVDYGETVAYELGSVQDSVLATGHVVTLTGLDPGVDYHLQVTATDESLNATVSPDVFFSTTTDPSGIVSDDFNTGQLDTGLWWFVDPLSDGQVALDGTRALISVPSGASHDMWGPGFESPRIMQAAEDTDFEIEVKFESLPSAGYQMQGLVVEQDSGNLIRADFYSDGSSVQIFSAAFSNGSPSVKVNSSINVSGSELYLRLARQGNTWTPSYSGDGLNWVQATSFDHSLAVQSVGVFAGNYSSQSAPAYTAVVDYFFNTAVPIEPEDGNTLYAVTVGVTGSGSVTMNPDQAVYQPGELVELTAVPAPGWTFTGWSGDATGPDNPLNVVVNANLSITAAFTSPSQVSLDVTIVGSGQVSLDPPGGVYSEGSVVELTAVGDPNWQFAAWSGDLTGTQNPATIVMTRDQAVVGSFSFSPGPVIDVWYGSDQTFGSIGVPQPWVNILGNVSDPDGVSQLTFSLNGGPEQDLSMGPYRRLEEPGDFNVEIAFVDLFDGVNQVDIYARDGLGNLSTGTVSVNFASGNVWPLDYSIDWSSESRVQDSAQVVDGLWQFTDDRLRPSAYGYDRTVAIGDRSWTDYEVLVPITLHGFSPEGFTGVNTAPAIGIVLRWPGHTNWTGDQQPSWGWYPGGATGWYQIYSSYGGGDFYITDFDRLRVTDPTDQYLLFDVTYFMRMRVETLGEGSSRYSLKVWDANEQEPQEWEVVAIDTDDVPSGSLLLIAHYVDVSFGNILIQPIPVEPQ